MCAVVCVFNSVVPLALYAHALSVMWTEKRVRAEDEGRKEYSVCKHT